MFIFPFAWFIFLIIFIVSAVKKGEQAQQRNPQQPYTQQMNPQQPYAQQNQQQSYARQNQQSSAARQNQASRQQSNPQQNAASWQQEQMNATKQRLKDKYKSSEDRSGILTRATANAQRVAEDRLGAIQNANDAAFVEHEKMHGRNPDFIDPEADSPADGSLLGSLSDLMVKGYSGQLSFERDFVGEGMDMLAGYLKMPGTK